MLEKNNKMATLNFLKQFEQTIVKRKFLDRHSINNCFSTQVTRIRFRLLVQ